MGADFGPRFLFLVFVQLRFNLTLNHLAYFCGYLVAQMSL
jgi:hypothetical protein